MICKCTNDWFTEKNLKISIENQTADNKKKKHNVY